MVTDRLVGHDFARYHIEAVIGRGGMGVVYRATDSRLGRPVALKVLSDDRSSDPSFRDRFIRESRLLASIDHPNIVPIYEADEVDGTLYIAMRYVPGPELRRIIEDEAPMDPTRTVAIIAQVADALDAAHATGLVHRDVKPGNILVMPATTPGAPGHAYLTDFGLTKSAGSDSGLTMIGQFVGTPGYVAPEQIEGRPVDHRVDVYALGCILYNCLSGDVPYPRDSTVASLWAHLKEPPPVLSERRAGLPMGLDAVITRALAKSPDDRYQTCGALAVAARRALLGEAPALEPIASADPGPAAGAMAAATLVGEARSLSDPGPTGDIGPGADATVVERPVPAATVTDGPVDDATPTGAPMTDATVIEPVVAAEDGPPANDGPPADDAPRGAAAPAAVLAGATLVEDVIRPSAPPPADATIVEDVPAPHSGAPGPARVAPGDLTVVDDPSGEGPPSGPPAARPPARGRALPAFAGPIAAVLIAAVAFGAVIVGVNLAGGGGASASPPGQAAAGSSSPSSSASPAPSGAYRAVAGDTLASIALRFGVTIDALLALNPNLTLDGPVVIGQPIVLPAAATPPAAPGDPGASSSPAAADSSSASTSPSAGQRTATPTARLPVATARVTPKPVKATAKATAKPTAAPVNHAPTAVATNWCPLYDDRNSTLDVLKPSLASDPDGDVMHIVSWTGPNNGAGSLSQTTYNGKDALLFDPTSGYSGTAQFSLTIADSHGAKATQIVDWVWVYSPIEQTGCP